MGQKQSTAENSTTIENNASDKDTTQCADIIDRVRRIPAKYFGGHAVQNDASMRQMQRDLLLFDDKLKNNCCPRKKSKQSKKRTYSEGYHSEGEPNYDQNHRSLSDDDEPYQRSIYIDPHQPIKTKRSSWRCRYCTAENKLTDIECWQCNEIETIF